MEFRFEDRSHYPKTWFRLDPTEEIMGVRFIKLVEDQSLRMEDWSALVMQTNAVIMEVSRQMANLSKLFKVATY